MVVTVPEEDTPKDPINAWRFVELNEEATTWMQHALNSTWLGQDIAGMSRKELLAVIGSLMLERDSLEKSLDFWFQRLIHAQKTIKEARERNGTASSPNI